VKLSYVYKQWLPTILEAFLTLIFDFCKIQQFFSKQNKTGEYILTLSASTIIDRGAATSYA
jgi:hypothetical protein